MITLRRSEERGHFNRGWLDTYHTFSFGNYYDPEFMGFRALRVINQDRVKPGYGFPTHPHDNMEILTYVLEGALEHRDSMGTGSTIRPGEMQRMSAGTGVFHSESNPSQTDPVHLLQIWILPARENTPPGYEQKAFPAAERNGRLRLVASPDGRDGSVTVRQDVNVFTAALEPGQAVSHIVPADRYAWLHVARGVLTMNGQRLSEGDGAAITGAETLEISGVEPAELLLFDLA
ncbi:MAG TPA: pirin family protein [Armatimonadota bacterium]|nr:pirin family protein [Armatimonadota bacterium]